MKVFLDATLLIYLNTLSVKENSHQEYKDFYAKLMSEELYVNALVLDETLYISKSRYHVPYGLSFEFLKQNVLPYSALLSIEESDISLMENYLSRYGKINPSDAIHLATMEREGITNIATEDNEFDDVKEVKRIWLSSVMRSK